MAERFEHVFRLALDCTVDLGVTCTVRVAPRKFDVELDLHEYVDAATFDWAIGLFGICATEPSEFVMFGSDGVPWRYDKGDDGLRKQQGRCVFDGMEQPVAFSARPGV